MKVIELTQGQYVLVDDCDYDDLSQHLWRAVRLRNYYYASRKIGRNKTIFMHRVIIGATASNQIVDHVNRDGLDNRRCNLRICNHTQNGWNRRVQKSQSGFKGVHRNWNKFRAQIVVNGHKQAIGNFDNAIDAAIAYDKAALKEFGEFACINFPE